MTHSWNSTASGDDMNIKDLRHKYFKILCLTCALYLNSNIAVADESHWYVTTPAQEGLPSKLSVAETGDLTSLSKHCKKMGKIWIWGYKRAITCQKMKASDSNSSNAVTLTVKGEFALQDPYSMHLLALQPFPQQR